jgi:nucleoside-diphosphate-sugar epimerase
VINVASSVYLAATAPEAAGQAFTIADDESTSIDDFYRIVAEIYLPHKKLKTIPLPFWSGFIFGSIISFISNALNLKRPFADPSLYALYSVSRNLAFSNRKIRNLCISNNIKFITLEEGIAAIRNNR